MNGYEDGVSIGQARAWGKRGLVLGVIGLWTVLWAGLALAQNTQSPEDFLNSLAKLDSSYAPAGSADTGEAVDLYTGSLGFVVTDVSLPGNSDLRVALQRHFSVGSPGSTNEDYAFADWQLEVPVITGIVGGDTPFHANQSGWRYVTGTGANAFDRCTHFGQMPNELLVGPGSPTDRFTPTEYWGGFELKVPGSGTQTLLGRDAGNTHAPSVPIAGHSSFPVVTKNDWVAACLPSLSNSASQPGEGFLVIAPDGRKFWFDWLVYRDVMTISKPAGRFAALAQDDQDNPATDGGNGANGTNSPQVPQTANLPRLRALLYATKVEDRFGHYVNYTYGGNGAADDQLTHIEADDGRQIDIKWANGHIERVTAQPQLADDSDPDTNPRVWQYGYNSFNKSLTSVVLPDNSAWGYTLSDLNYGGRSLGGAICEAPNYSNSTHGGGGTLEGHLITPAGLKVEYQLTDTARGHADTPIDCLYGAGQTKQGGYYFGQPAYSKTYFVWALTTRTESGPGVASRSWNYAYSDAHGSWSNECSSGCPYDTVWTTVTDPDNRLTEYTYSNVFDATEGQLKKIEYHNTNSASGSGVRSQVNQYAAYNAGPWPERYGYPSVSSGDIRSNAARAGSRTPLQTRTTSEGGIDYAWNASAFDSWADPTSVTRNSTGSDADSVTEALAYENNQAVWVLGQFKSRKVTADDSPTDDDVGKIPESRTYHASDATLDTISRFGHTVATYTWYPTGGGADGKLASVKDGNNHTTSYSHYAYGVPQAIGYADATSISLTPNNYGEVLDVSDELGHTTTVERDAMGRITQKIFPSDTGTGHAWDPVNIAYDQITTAEYGVGVGSTRAHWRVTRTQGRKKQVTVYDAALNPVLTSAVDTFPNPDVGHMSWHQFDSAGRTVFASYPLDYASSLPGSKPGVATSYDVLGRVTGTEADAESPLNTVTTATTYNTGNQIDFRDGRGHHTVTTYQAFDRPSYSKPVRTAFEYGIITTVERDSFGAPTKMKQTGTYAGNPISVTHRFGYDDYHRLCKQVSPETKQTAYGYDGADNLQWTAEGLNDAVPTQCTISPPPSAKISRDYDNRNRLIKIDYPSGTPDKHFTYYPDGRLHYATRDTDDDSTSSTWTMKYFNRGLLKQEKLEITTNAGSHSFALGYDYDDEGARSTVTYPAIGTVDFAPDGLGRPTQAGSYATGLKYAPSSQLTDLDYGNGISAQWGYNTRNLLDATTYALGSDLTHRSLEYDKNGNLKKITDTINGSNCSTSDTIFCNGFELPSYTGTGNWAFDYDNLDRLLEVTNPYVPDVFTYDPLGNIRTTSELGTFAYDATNRIKSRTGGLNFVWSDRGTLTTDGERSFTWNRANELTADSQGGSFGYDANGWRMRKARNGTLEYYVYNHAHQLMLRWNNTTQTETDFVHLGGKTVARIEGGQTTYIQPDYHGSPLFETGSNGTITRQPFYLGYGRTTAEGRSKIPGYTGAAMDVTTGHTYLGARYLYHKRFTSPDPVGLDPTSPTGLNRYAYAADDPVNNVDPFGTCATDKSEADTPCPEPTEPPPPPPPPKQPTTLPTTTVTATTITLSSPLFELPQIPWTRLAGGLLGFGGGVLTTAVGIALPTTMDAPACELPGGPFCSNVMSSSYPPGYWPGDAGAAEWGKKNGIGAKAGKDKFHRGVKEHTPGARGDHDYGVNPDTGEVIDQNGEPVGNLNDE